MGLRGWSSPAAGSRASEDSPTLVVRGLFVELLQRVLQLAGELHREHHLLLAAIDLHRAPEGVHLDAAMLTRPEVTVHSLEQLGPGVLVQVLGELVQNLLASELHRPRPRSVSHFVSPNELPPGR